MIFRALIILSFLFPFSLLAASEKTRWSLEMNMSLFQPKDDNWETYYGSKRMPTFGGAIAYRIFQFIDIGASIDYGQDRGTGTLPISDIQTGSVVYHIIPIDIFAVARLKFTENQWIVPYAGGGYTRFVYYQSIAGQDSVRGSVNGVHAKAGLQFLLDGLDASAAKRMFSNYGATNSYLYVEVKRTHAKTNTPSFQIGGYSVKSGLFIEFN